MNTTIGTVIFLYFIVTVVIVYFLERKLRDERARRREAELEAARLRLVVNTRRNVKH